MARPATGRIPGKTFKNKKMAGHLGDERITTLNLEVAAVDAERGLIMVRGAVPGAKDGWVLVRDAIKRKAPEEAAVSGGLCVGAPAAPKLADAERSRPGLRNNMQIEIKTLDRAARPARPTCPISFRGQGPPGHHRPRDPVAADEAPRRTHKIKGMGEVSGTTRKPYKQKGTGNARQGSLRAPQFRTGGVVHGPVRATTATTCRRRCAGSG